MVYNELKKIVGEDRVKKSIDYQVVYSTDASTEEGNPYAVIFPETAEEVKRIVRVAGDNFMDVVPRGGGTGLAGGVVPNRSLVLNMSKMSEVLEVSEGLVLVQAGIVLDDLNHELKEEGSFLPVVPASHQACTIGGMIACNASGKRSIRYGKMCDWVKYLEVVDGDGRVRRINDVKKFCGSEGTLGVIVKAGLKTTKRPSKVTLDVYRFDNVPKLINTVEDLKSKPGSYHLLSLEVLGPRTSSLLDLEERYHLIVEYDNNIGLKKSEELLKKWNALRDKTYNVLACEGYTRIQDPEFKKSTSLKQFIKYLDRNSIPFFGHIGVGIIHPCLNKSMNEKELYELINSLGGNVTGEHGVGLTKKEYIDEDFKNRIKLYKESLDENNIMNRGKIV